MRAVSTFQHPAAPKRAVPALQHIPTPKNPRKMVEIVGRLQAYRNLKLFTPRCIYSVIVIFHALPFPKRVFLLFKRVFPSSRTFQRLLLIQPRHVNSRAPSSTPSHPHTPKMCCLPLAAPFTVPRHDMSSQPKHHYFLQTCSRILERTNLSHLRFSSHPTVPPLNHGPILVRGLGTTMLD
jgi:hypothetical protein